MSYHLSIFGTKKRFPAVLRNELLGIASDFISQGFVLIPLGADKKPFWALLPKVEKETSRGVFELKPSWKALVEQGPTSLEQVELWLDAGACGLAVATGGSSGLYIFDIDEPRFFDKWITGDVRDIFSLVQPPVTRTGSGGFHIFVCVVGDVPGPKTLAWIKDDSRSQGRSIAIETRGTGNYIVLPFSIHPDRVYYEPCNAFGGSFANVPQINVGVRERLENGARDVCECPKSKQDIEREQRQKKQEAPKRMARHTRRREGPSVIDHVNSSIDIEDALTRCGYVDCGNGRFGLVKGKPTIGVNYRSNTSSHYSSNDPLSDGRAKTPFNLICWHEHNDDLSSAVKAMAEELDMDYVGQREQERREQAYKATKATKVECRQDSHDKRPKEYIPPSLRSFYKDILVEDEYDWGDCDEQDQQDQQDQQDLYTDYDDYVSIPEYSTVGDQIQYASDYIGFEAGDDLDCGQWAVELPPAPPSPAPAAPAAPAPAAAAPAAAAPAAPAPAAAAPAAPTAPAAPAPYHYLSPYQRFDWKAYAAQIRQAFDVASYVATNFDEPPPIQDPFKLVALKLFGSTDTGKKWSLILRAAAKHAEVAWPDFSVLGCTLSDIVEIAKAQAASYTKIELQPGQYLSDVLDYNTLTNGAANHVVAGCGFGKTRAADGVHEKSFYSPMTRQAITFAESANGRGAEGHVVCEGEVHLGQPSIYSTYDGAKKELELIRSEINPLKLRTRICFVDEVQHLTSDGYRRTSAIQPLLKAANLYKAAGGKIVTLTGTPAPAYPTPLGYQGSHIIHVVQDRPTSKLKLFHESDPIEAITAKLKEGYTHITYSIDDKTKCEFIASKLTEMGIKALPIHSDNKKEAFHKAYVGEEGKDGIWDNSVTVYVTTRATVDGFSVQIQAQAVRLAEMFDSSLKYGSTMIEQRRRRVRNYPAEVFVGMSEKALARFGKGGHFDYMEELSVEMEIGHEMLSSAKRIRLIKANREAIYNELDEALAIANDYILKEYKGWVCFDENGELELDESAILNRIDLRWKEAAHACPDIMIRELGEHGLEFCGIEDLSGNEDAADERKRFIREEKAARKEAKLSLVQTEAAKMSLVEARVVRMSPAKVIKEEGDVGKAKVVAAGMIIELSDAGLTEQAAREEIGKLSSLRKDRIKRIKNETEMAKLRRIMSKPETFEALEDKKAHFLYSLQNGCTFKFGEVLPSAEIVARAREMAEVCGIPEIMVALSPKEKRKIRKQGGDETRYDSNKKIMRLIGEMYRLKKRNRMVNGKKTDLYEFVSFLEVDLAPIKK